MRVVKKKSKGIMKRISAVLLAVTVVVSNSAIGTLNVKATELNVEELPNVQEVIAVSENDVENTQASDKNKAEDNNAAQTNERLEVEAEEIEKTGSAEILYSGRDGNLDWSIDEDGLLVITGTGNYACEYPEWTEYGDEVCNVYVKVEGITNAKYMFADLWCETIDISNLDTSKVTTMYGMFSNCYCLEEVDLSGLDTSKVTTMRDMFYGCGNLKVIDLGNLDTSKVTTTQDMFYGCDNLEIL